MAKRETPRSGWMEAGTGWRTAQERQRTKEETSEICINQCNRGAITNALKTLNTPHFRYGFQ